MPRVSERRSRPHLRVLDDVLDGGALASVRGAAADLRDGAPLPLTDSPSLPALDGILRAALGLPPELPARFAVVRMAPGEARRLSRPTNAAAAGVLFLSPTQGGALRFPDADPSLQVAPVAGRAVVWRATDADGRPDAAARHAVAPVRGGEHLALAWTLGEGAPVLAGEDRVAGAASESAGAEGGTFVCVVDPDTPETTRRFLRDACAARGVSYVERIPAAVAPWEPPLEPGTLLYRPATSWAAGQVEAQLYQPGVVTFWRRPEGPFLVPTEAEIAFVRAGLPVPRTAWLRNRDKEALSATLEWLGGPPVVLRVPGGEGGVGVMRVDSLASLLGLVDLLGERGVSMRLSTFVPEAEHWRLVVVGERVVTAYRNPLREDDFRSAPSDSRDDYGLAPSAELTAVAVRASHVVGAELAGVDVLVHPSGRVYLLEANFPCYFGQATEAAGIDVAGPMLDHLLGRR